MRIARFVRPGGPAFGVLDGDDVLAEIDGHPFGELTFTGKRWPIADVRLLSPILPSKVIGFANNFIPDGVPTLFLKPSTTVVGPNDTVRLPDVGEVVAEAHLAVVIGARGARNVGVADALARVFGYTLATDLTATGPAATDGQPTRAKAYDSFCPVGPWIETDFRPENQLLSGGVDETVGQQATLDGLRADVATLIAYASTVMTLLPGDIILTGTPAPAVSVQPGQRIVASVVGLGELVNPVSTL